ncbi:meiosis 1 arrest protein isoform X3 [Marmota monax]|uniref:meiosis 1 arrest protein isoform X3 n=1 Tax=Marmota monax TaxID=9995 RepID=UPI001EAFF2AA|nr:meiosis 1 arrest protein isoform X3 [Marmota monax]
MHHGRAIGKGPSTATQTNQQPPRLLIVHIALPDWADICSNLCEALQNFFSLACSLMGPSRMSLFSLYMVQNQHECILPFVQVKGNFVRLKACISELRMIETEGCFRPQSTSLQLAIQDGLQQFKQYSRYVTTGAALPYTSLEITVLTSHPGKEVVKQLEEGLKDIDLVRVRRLQVVEITKRILELMDSASPVEEPSNDESSILGTDIELQIIDNDVISMEFFFKAWLHNSGTDQEHIHLLLPSQCFSNISSARDNPMCLKCDLQERLLSPSLLPGTADGASRMDDPKGDLSTLYQMASQSSASCYKLQVINSTDPMHRFLSFENLLCARCHARALKSSGLCESLTYGLPFILRPTSCWQLDWDELETNQQHFHALCHSLLSILDGLELEPTYNPLQVWSHLYSHLSSTFAKPQGRLYPNWENRTPRKAGQLQTNRVRATVLPLPMTPALSTAPKLPAASKASSEAFFRPSEWRKSIPHGPELLAPECSHPTQPPRPCQDPHNGYL